LAVSSKIKVVGIFFTLKSQGIFSAGKYTGLSVYFLL
jgi:hypothetical protein